MKKIALILLVTIFSIVVSGCSAERPIEPIQKEADPNQPDIKVPGNFWGPPQHDEKKHDVYCQLKKVNGIYFLSLYDYDFESKATFKTENIELKWMGDHFESIGTYSAETKNQFEVNVIDNDNLEITDNFRMKYSGLYDRHDEYLQKEEK